MKKYLCSVCALLLCAVILVGCGKGKSFDITEYLDTGWATTDISPQYYELYLASYMLEGYDGTDTFVDLTFRYYQNTGDYNVAEVFSTFDSAEFTSNALTFDFFDDGWGHSGKITLTFNKDSIDVSISDLQGGFGGEWGLAEDRVTLYKNPDVTNDPISGGSEEFYDTSKASGILASIGMTEQEFRAVCTYINSSAYGRNEYAYAAGRQYYAERPEDIMLSLLDVYTEEWEDYLVNGTESEYYDDDNKWYLDSSSSLDDYLNLVLYGGKGASILGEQSKEYFGDMLEYPNNYLGNAFLLKDFIVDYKDNYTYYGDGYILYGVPTAIIDIRDDVNSPNILNKTRYDMYVLFQGTYNTNSGATGLLFHLISVEKVAN